MERALVEYIANAIWQIPLLAGGAWLLIRGAKPSPLAQHYLWLAVLALAVLLPARGIRKSPTVPEMPLATTKLELPMPTVGEPALLPLPSQPPQRNWLLLPTRVRNVQITASAVRCLAGLYLAVALFGLARIAFAWHSARQLVAQSQPVTLSPQSMEILQFCAQRIQVQLPQLRQSCEVSSPMIVGASCPTLLLPRDFARYAEDEIKAALCHELAHLRRHDYLVNLICQVASLPVAWHPVTHEVQRRLRRTREMVCDALAAREVGSGIGYAKSLLTLAEGMLRGQVLTERTQVLGLFSHNTLEERVMQLMETKRATSLRAKLARVAGGATGMVAAIVLSAVFHVSPIMAESKAAPPQDAQTTPAPAQTDSAPDAEQAATPEAAPESSNVRVDQKKEIHISKNGKRVVIVNGIRREPTPQEQREIDQQMADAQKQLDTDATLQRDDFERQMDDVKRQMIDIQVHLNSADIQRQIEEASRQATEFALHKEEFKQQMAELQKQLQSGEFQKQIAEATRQATGPEFRADLQREIDKAINSLKDVQEQLKKEKIH